MDDTSTDDSVRRIKERFPNIILIETEKNRGYSGGNNVGVSYGINNGAEYFLIVNNDTELVNPHFVQEMIEKVEDDPLIGVAGPMVRNIGGQIQDTILFTPTLFNCIKKSFGLRVGSKKINDYSIL